MELEYIRIEKNADWHSRPGEYSGSLKYKGQHGTVEIQLDAQLSADVLALCADSMTRATKDLAQNLTAAVFAQAQPMLEAPDA